MVPISIGRNQGNDVILHNDKVSGVHARAFYNDNEEIVLEDLDSRNGTFIDGRKIKQTVIGEKSAIILGDELIDFSEISMKLRHKNRDFTEEFSRLKEVYSKFRDDLERIRKQDEKKNFIIRLGFSLVPLLFLLFFNKSIPQNLRILFYTGSPVIFMVISYFKQLSSKSKRQIEEISEQFLKEYKCPSCRCSLGNASWNLLADQKMCFTCKAIWIKEKKSDKIIDHGEKNHHL